MGRFHHAANSRALLGGGGVPLQAAISETAASAPCQSSLVICRPGEAAGAAFDTPWERHRAPPRSSQMRPGGDNGG